LANEVQLQEGHPVDENIRPIKVGGKTTAIETAQSGDGAKITGNLDVIGQISGNGMSISASEIIDNAITLAADNDITLTAGGEIILDAGGDIVLDAYGQQIFFKDGVGGTTHGHIDVATSSTLKIRTTTNYDLLLQSAGTGDITLDAGEKIILDSATGEFEMHGGGTTAKFADMYAGMILGYRSVGLNESHASKSLTTSFVVPTDEFGVTFIVPPSGNVEISIQVWFGAGSSGQSLVGSLSSDNNTDGYTQYGGNQYDELIYQTPARNFYGPAIHSWVLTGLTAGDSNTIYAAFKTGATGGTPKLYWGGTLSGRYPDFIMKATALPATIAT